MHFSKPAEFNSFEICLEFYFIFIHLFFFFQALHSHFELMTYMSFDDCFRFHCRRVGLIKLLHTPLKINPTYCCAVKFLQPNPTGVNRFNEENFNLN